MDSSLSPAGTGLMSPGESMSHSVVALPLEIIQQVVDCLADDLYTLRQCAVVNGPFPECARATLYRHITFKGEAMGELRLLSRTLSIDPRMGALVKTLEISDLAHTPRSHAGSPNIHLVRESLPFHMLSQLHTLRLYAMRYRGADELLSILVSLPRLRLHCENVSDWYAFRSLLALPSPENLPRQPLPLGTLLPVLRTLVIKDGSWGHDKLAERLVNDYRETVRELRNIELSFGGSAEAIFWVPVIRAAGPSLRSISMSLADRSTPMTRARNSTSEVQSEAGRYPNDHAFVMDVLATCRSLQFLRLKYELPDCMTGETATPSDDFIRVLCAALCRRQPEVPWPAIEQLELWLPDRGQEVFLTPELGVLLARALLDKARYPRFKRLSVRIRIQFWSSYMTRWSRRSLSDSDPDDSEEEVVRRWKANLSEFENEDGVSLDVDVLDACESGTLR
ncbi:hypothetical protein BN946_scf184706.g5 [Trametes cinnabarina]|uniref:F-box domain-containing protein n=1 Tax=Pycnoporus cinnabarinus TaxID=5643 RepID=A0A060SL83_PYCCI|nr:hypothetical protein BN946_scf184706.g5 [Trametes cinnabarina]